MYKLTPCEPVGNVNGGGIAIPNEKTARAVRRPLLPVRLHQSPIVAVAGGDEPKWAIKSIRRQTVAGTAIAGKHRPALRRPMPA